MPPRKKIDDGKGNTFWPSEHQWQLWLAGWRVVERQKQGCMRVITWRDPATGETWSQGVAFGMMTFRRRLAKVKGE